MTNPNRAVLVAPGTVTRREWQKAPVEIPLAEARDYDRLARELGHALGTPVRVTSEADSDAWVLLVVAGQADELADEVLARTLLLDASPSDQVDVVQRRLLGAVMEDALEAWRRGDAPEEPALFGLKDVAERMSGSVSTKTDRFGYTVIAAGAALPEVIAEYLRAIDRPS